MSHLQRTSAYAIQRPCAAQLIAGTRVRRALFLTPNPVVLKVIESIAASLFQTVRYDAIYTNNVQMESVTCHKTHQRRVKSLEPQ